MKKKTYFRIQLFSGSNKSCDAAVLAAALVNGEGYSVPLKVIKDFADEEKCPNTYAELIGDSLLHIDTKIGDTYKTVCVIEKVEIMELGKVVEMDNPDDIPGELFTQSNGHGGLAD